MRPVAWNGIRFLLPLSWQPSRIALKHLAFEDENGPVFEICWSLPGRGRKNQKTIYNSLKRTAKSKHCQIQRETLPESWHLALPKYTLSRFTWHSEAFAAEGVMIVCPLCGRTTLMQFFHLPGRPHRSLVDRILSTFRDHQKEGMILWSLYDIEAYIPQEFQLVKYQFNSGAFMLVFKQRHDASIMLYRFAPAAVILKQTSLNEFALSHWPSKSHQPEQDRSYNGPLIYPTPPSLPLFKRILCSLRGKDLNAWVQVRHLEDINRILAVRVEGRGRDIKGFLFTIAQRYSHVQEIEQH